MKLKLYDHELDRGLGWFFALIVYLLVVLWALGVFGTARAEAASLRFCWDEASVPIASVANVPAFVNDQPLYPDLLATSTLSGTRRCSTQPFPATLVRGQNVAITIRSSNALGEVGPASNAVTFQAPNVPSAPAGLAVSGVSQ